MPTGDEMSSGDDPPSRDRIDALEERVARLERTVSALQDGEVTDATGKDLGETEGSNDGPSQAWLDVSADIRSVDWLSTVGIGLLLLGLVFLFEYSIEQGWLGPPVRVGFGGILGTILLGAGLRIDDRHRLRPVLLGGSSAVFYGTVFAAYQLYGLLPYLPAFGTMVIITVASIVLSLQQNASGMAVVGTAGGLATPFLLYAEASGLVGFTGYTWLVLMGACAVYLMRGWRVLLCTTVVGGWATLLWPCIDIGAGGGRPQGTWALQGGLVGTWVLLAGTPVARAVLQDWYPERWIETPRPWWLAWTSGPAPTFGMVTASPALALLGSRFLWEGSEILWVSVAAGGAVLYGGAYVALRRVPLPRYASAHGLAAALLAAYGTGVALGGAPLLLAWAVEATLLLELARRLGERTLRVTGHLLFGIVSVGMAEQFLGPAAAGPPLVALEALSQLAVVALVAVTARRARALWVRRAYGGAALVGWLGWAAHELAVVTNGQAYVSAVWAGTAAALLAGGAWRRWPGGQWAGGATLVLFVGKLFLVDLVTVPVLLRVVLFVGAGGGFLLVSYLLPQVGAPRR